ncbi:hypothetical protein L596_011902 [Steinernema carpocapsae]|uniref:Nuclear receptor domain-containing protein n=2 Tax=Steinernema carpocapsae TaxID=34508 RepID=A0A4U5NWA5_STECR|nr:hypothetical protein L596_011902 [Steinernema carpocapsae]
MFFENLISLLKGMEDMSEMEGGSPKRFCRVCGDNAHGSHFQVLTCRACAAFFRRTCQQCRKYTCRKGSGGCDVSKNAPYNCRYCRYEKCKNVGMKYHTQTDLPSDVTMSSISPIASTSPIATRIQEEPPLQIPIVPPILLSVPMPVMPTVPVNFSEHQILLETHSLMTQIKAILDADVINYGPSLGAFRMTTMQRMLLAYEDIFAELRHVQLPDVTVISSKDFNPVALDPKITYIQAAKFLMSFPQFANLDFRDKWQIFKRSTQLFGGVLHAYPTMRLFRDKSDFRMYFGNRLAVNVEHSGLGLANDPQDKSFSTISRTAIEKIVNPMREILIHEYELVFIQILLCWNVQGMKTISENAKEVANQVVEEVSNEIHNFYMVDLRMTNYAARLVKLLNLQINLDDFANQKKRQFEIGNLFNLFENELLGDKLGERTVTRQA